MQRVTTLDNSLLKAHTWTPFNQPLKPHKVSGVTPDMRFVTIKKAGRPLMVKCHGSVGEEPSCDTSEFQRGFSFKFKPPLEDFKGWSDLDSILEIESDDRDRLLEMIKVPKNGDEYAFDWIHRPKLDDTYMLKIPLKTDDKGQFVFTCNETINEDNFETYFKKNAQVTLNAFVGFYFNENANEQGERFYGMYLKPDTLEFISEEPEKPKTKARGKK